GTMSVEELLDILDSLLDGKVLGVDVCGEKKEEPAFYEREKSEKINRKISNYLDRKNPLW
ncbi:MAG: hypothetical protein K6F30_11580, partial [Lachnospiraceae bacterium]|nr:hypothetical protein [Lachnospiraceae bacterium]